jgi:hypothetical protein
MGVVMADLDADFARSGCSTPMGSSMPFASFRSSRRTRVRRAMETAAAG